MFAMMTPAQQTMDRLYDYCEHGRQWHYCRLCKGPSVCMHGSRRAQCTICKGKGICPCGRRRYYCVACKGNGICMHNRRRCNCRICKAEATASDISSDGPTDQETLGPQGKVRV